MKLLVSLFFMISFSGCALVSELRKPKPSPEPAERRLTMEEKHEAMVGKTEDELIEAYGAPAKTESIGSYKVWSYFTDRGASHSGGTMVTQGAYGMAFGSTRTNSQNHFQLSRFYFKEGKVVRWDYDRK